MKKEFKITEHEADLLERIAAATKMDDWFYITEDLNEARIMIIERKALWRISATLR